MPATGLPSIEGLSGESFDLGFAHRRLAITDLSVAGHQPMSAADGGFWLIHNGEIYNFRGLRDELRLRGYEFRSDTDTEVILAAYQEWGVDCVSRFNGMWSFALLDTKRRTIFCSRDRFGIKPLFFAKENGSIAFASEIKALVGPHGRPFEPDPSAVAKFIAMDVFPSARNGDTFFEGIRALPAGCCEVIDPGGQHQSRYYAVQIHEEPVGVSDNAVEEFRALLIDSVRLQLKADVPVGSCLSGGLDSSVVVAAIDQLLGAENSRNCGGGQLTFSSVFTEPGPYNEREFVDAVLERIPARGVLVFPSLQDLEDDLEAVVWHQDEPFGDLSIFAQWCVMRAVKARGLSVLLDGQGADEILGGYAPHPTHVADLLGRGDARGAIRELRSLCGANIVGAARIAASALVRQLPSCLQGVLRNRRWRDRSAFALLSPGVREAARAESTLGYGYAEDQRSLSQLLRFQVEEGVLPTLLRYEDRNSMAFGLEGRVPFLDHRVVEFAFSKGAPLRMCGGWTKWLLRKAFSDLLPDSIIWRKDKVGFGVPGAWWLQHLFRRDPRLLSSASPAGEYLDLPRARKLHEELGSDSSKSAPLWRCLNLEMWLRSWRDTASALAHSAGWHGGSEHLGSGR